ncbi:unnamed protein product [Ectocarpus sp. 12 AP-2014]
MQRVMHLICTADCQSAHENPRRPHFDSFYTHPLGYFSAPCPSNLVHTPVAHQVVPRPIALTSTLALPYVHGLWLHFADLQLTRER